MWLLATLVAGIVADLPLLTELMLDVCGGSSFSISPTSPCQYHVFGVSMAWSECSHTYANDMQGFKYCLFGCTSKNLCEDACKGPIANSTQCLTECAMMVQCVNKALDSEAGQTAAEVSASQCFQGSKSTQPLLLQDSSAALAAVQAAASAPRMPTQIAHLKGDLTALYPEGCELRQQQKAPMPVPEHPKLDMPPADFNQLRPQGPATAPFIKDQILKWHALRTAWGQPLPSEWHDQHWGFFTGPEATLPDGPPLPPALLLQEQTTQAPALVDVHVAESSASPVLNRPVRRVPLLRGGDGWLSGS